MNDSSSGGRYAIQQLAGFGVAARRLGRRRRSVSRVAATLKPLSRLSSLWRCRNALEQRLDDVEIKSAATLVTGGRRGQ
jgi:hypothetical protein